MRLSRFLLASVLACAPSLLLAQNENSAEKLPKLAVERSQLTLPGSRPFHIRLRVSEATNPDNDEYNGEIEEYWVAPDKWRRTVKTASFSQTLVVNADKVEEHLTGSYYPNWMRTLVNAVFEPGAVFDGIELRESVDSPQAGGPEVCRRFDIRVGMPPISNRLFAGYCLRDGLIVSMGGPGLGAEFSNYKKFGEKDVAYEIREFLEPGTEVSAVITELSELEKPDEGMFLNQQLRTAKLSEEALRKLVVGSLTPTWPPVRGGKTAGVLSIYVCLDKDGRVQETYGLNSDHPEMTDAARQQIANWKFNPEIESGVPVQVEGILTFAYQTQIGDPYPVLNDAEARKQSITLEDPNFPEWLPKGLTGTVRVLVGEDGTVHTWSPEKLPQEMFGPMMSVIPQWRFRPYLRDGKPTEFNADLTFIAK